MESSRAASKDMIMGATKSVAGNVIQHAGMYIPRHEVRVQREVLKKSEQIILQ